QASGAQDLGPASDVYSLACVLYEMLAGDPPFTAARAQAVMAKHVTEAPRPVRGFRPEVPMSVELAIAQALEKDPARRTASAAQFIAALVAQAFGGPPRSPATRSIAVLPFVNASPDVENEYLSDGITDELIDALAKISGLRVSSRTSVFALKGKPLDVPAHVPRRYTENIQAYGLYLKGRYEWNKRTQEGVAAAIRYFERAIVEDPGYAPAYAGLSDSYSLDVDYRSIPVHESYQRAKEYARKALSLDESVPTAHASLAWAVFIYDWHWEEAEREFRRAIELNPRYASAHQWFAFLLAARGQLDAALLEAHTALELDPA